MDEMEAPGWVDLHSSFILADPLVNAFLSRRAVPGGSLYRVQLVTKRETPDSGGSRPAIPILDSDSMALFFVTDRSELHPGAAWKRVGKKSEEATLWRLSIPGGDFYVAAQHAADGTVVAACTFVPTALNNP